MKIDRIDTALVVIDPQNDVLNEKDISWDLVGASVRENDTVANLERLFKAAKEGGYGVFISPHYLYPAHQTWQFGGPMEKGMLDTREFYRRDQVAVVKDATAAPRPPQLGDGSKSAIVNFGFLANEVLTTAEAVHALMR